MRLRSRRKRTRERVRKGGMLSLGKSNSRNNNKNNSRNNNKNNVKNKRVRRRAKTQEYPVRSHRPSGNKS